MVKAQYNKHQVLHNKRLRLKEAREKLFAIQKLINRNKTQEEANEKNAKLTSQEITETIQEIKEISDQENSHNSHQEFVDKIHFPLLVVRTPNTKDNRVNI